MSESSDTVRVSLSSRHWPLSWFRHPEVPGVTVDTAGVDVDRETADKLVQGAQDSGIELHVADPAAEAPEEKTDAGAPATEQPATEQPTTDSTVSLPATTLDDDEDTTKGAE